MAQTSSAPGILERHYLELRCALLEMAASLDRLERAGGFTEVKGDARLKRIQDGLKILASAGTDRAERIQMLFSDVYDPDWNG
jgi:hypothetical protein